ncbi:hypothetical protein D3C81_1224590 [compost metagenome]
MRSGSSGQRIADVMAAEQIELDPRYTQGAVQVERRAATLIMSDIARVKIRCAVVQRERLHRTITSALFPDAKGFVIKVQYGNAILIQTFKDFAFGFDNLLWPAELANMSSSGIVDQRYLRLGQANGVGDLANARSAQLDDRSGMLRSDFEQRQRRTKVVVQVAARSQDLTTGAQDAGKHFLDRGFAAGTGDGGDRLVERSAIECTELPQGQPAIGNQQLRQIATGHFALDQGRHGALGLHVIEVIVAIETWAGQGDEQLPGNDCAAVDADSGEGCIVTHQTSLQSGGQLTEGQGLKHQQPPRQRVLSRLRPDRKNRGAGR